MKIDRHVVARKNQWLVALPAELRRHLDLVTGCRVWWHIGRKGQATLTTSGRVRAGRARLEEECRACGKYRAEVERLRRELRDGEHGSSAGFFRQGYLQAVSDHGGILRGMESQREVLRDIRTMLRELIKERAAVAKPSLATHVTECPTCYDALIMLQPGADPCAYYRERIERGRGPVKRGPGRRRKTQPPPDPSPDVAVSEGEALAPGPSVPGQPIES